MVTRPRKSHTTMGRPRRPPTEPSDYPKKNEGIHFKLVSKPGSKPESDVPPVPKTPDLLEQDRNKPKRPKKNFMSKNVKNRFGMSKKVSTMEPKYIPIGTFGKTLMYLEHFIKVKTQNLQFKRDTTGLEQPKCRYITKDERDTFLRGLKENWEELQQNYQELPILADTIPKMQRKSKLEADLKQLKKDIVILERHPYIYVYNDNEQN